MSAGYNQVRCNGARHIAGKLGGNRMILFHGSNQIVAPPKLIQQNRFLDFGYGSAMAVLVFVIVFIISLIYMRAMGDQLTGSLE